MQMAELSPSHPLGPTNQHTILSNSSKITLLHTLTFHSPSLSSKRRARKEREEDKQERERKFRTGIKEVEWR
jgi:hypothetical protein